MSAPGIRDRLHLENKLIGETFLVNYFECRNRIFPNRYEASQFTPVRVAI
jgi:hypothetical protein